MPEEVQRIPLPVLDKQLLREFHATNRRHWARLILFLLLYGGAGILLVRLSTSGLPFVWLALIPLYLMAAASLHGISLFTHEAVHGTLSRNKVWNGVMGAICATPVLQNYSAYRVLHLEHHEHLGQEGDPDHYPNYTSWSWLVFLMNWGRLIIGYPVYIIAIPILGWRKGTQKDRWGIAAELGLNAVFLYFLFQLPFSVTLHAWLIPMLIINTFVNIRGMSQHTLLEEFHGDTVRGTRTILTNPVTTFFMCNENYHLEHHLYPGIPWYHLPKVHRVLKNDLVRLGAPYIPSYAAFVCEFIRGSFLRSPLSDKRKV